MVQAYTCTFWYKRTVWYKRTFWYKGTFWYLGDEKLGPLRVGDANLGGEHLEERRVRVEKVRCRGSGKGEV